MGQAEPGYRPSLLLHCKHLQHDKQVLPTLGSICPNSITCQELTAHLATDGGFPTARKVRGTLLECDLEWHLVPSLSFRRPAQEQQVRRGSELLGALAIRLL